MIQRIDTPPVIQGDPFHTIFLTSFQEMPHPGAVFWGTDTANIGVVHPASGFSCLYSNPAFLSEWARWLYQERIPLIAGELGTHFFILQRMGQLFTDSQLTCRFELQDFCVLKERVESDTRVREVDGTMLEILSHFYQQGEEVVSRSVADLKETLRYGRIVCIEEQGSIVSAALTHRESSQVGLIGGVYTKPDHRGQGYGEACVTTLCHSLQKEGKVPVLFYEKGNEAAEKLYQKLGFTYYGDWIIVELHYE